MAKPRTILLITGWLVLAVWIYVVVLGLELTWNLVDWEPRLNARTGTLLLGMVAGLGMAWVLASATYDRTSRVWSFFVCLALLGIAIYVLPEESLTHGLFGRSSASPLWYRGGRLLVMALPGVFWVLRLRHNHVPA